MRGPIVALAIMLMAAAASGADIAPGRQPERLLAEINSLRERHGLGKLSTDRRPATAARNHAADMVGRDFFDHRGPGGPGLAERVQRAGYAYAHVAENIAAGQEHAREVVASWMLSEGHRKNLLNVELSDAGIGYLDAPDDGGRVRYRHYWVAIFGRRSR
jgi:uncharacterized protein YkwD